MFLHVESTDLESQLPPLILIFFWVGGDGVSLCRLVWLETHFAEHVGLKLTTKIHLPLPPNWIFICVWGGDN